MAILQASNDPVVLNVASDPGPLIDPASVLKPNTKDASPSLSLNTRDPGFNNFLILALVGLAWIYRRRIF